jgi:hypothetical protein
MEKNSNPVTDFIQKNMFITLLSIAIVIAGATYGVMDKLVLVHYQLKIESQKDRISQLEKSDIVKSKTIDSLRNKLISCQRDTTIFMLPPDTRNSRIDQLIRAGEKLGKEFKNIDALDKYIDWRNKCISLISSIAGTEELLSKFKNTVNFNDSNYPMTPRMINDGIEILKEVKGKIKQ